MAAGVVREMAGDAAAQAREPMEDQVDTVEMKTRPNVVSDPTLVSLVQRINARMDEADAARADLKDLYAEAKSACYDPKGLRLAIKRQRETAEEVAKRLAVEESADYIAARLGDFGNSPLGSAAIGKAA